MINGYNSLVILESLAGYVLCILVALLGLVVAWLMLSGKINLTRLLSEKDRTDLKTETAPSASMSRFQLLVFTFVIALSFFLVVISNIKIAQSRTNAALPGLPEVPSGVLLLLGISASSYGVGKAIQHGTGTAGDSSDTTKKDDQHP